MKRYFLLIVLVMMVSWIAASHRSPFRRPAGPPAHWAGLRHDHDGDAGHRIAAETRRRSQCALAEAGDEFRQALDEARDDLRQAFAEARDDLHEAFGDVRVALVSDDDSSRALPPVPACPSAASEVAEGLPVPIVPGTRVTEAEARPPAPVAPTSAIAVVPGVSTQSWRWIVNGRLSATKERAVADARRQLRDDVASWLDPEVPRSWVPPVRMLDAMVVQGPQLKTIQKSYGELFEAALTVDASAQRRTALVEVYNRQLVERRLATLGATLVFILICLAAVSGYIRADEATKGYYTNRLRMLAAAGVGASGVIIYHMVA